MKVETIFLHEDTAFTKVIRTWADEHGVACEIYNPKDEDSFENLDGLVCFHENHNFDPNDAEMRDSFERHSKPIHKIDINGTLSATVSHYNLWIERNQVKKILIVGSKAVAENLNLERYLTNLKEM